MKDAVNGSFGLVIENPYTRDMVLSYLEPDDLKSVVCANNWLNTVCQRIFILARCQQIAQELPDLVDRFMAYRIIAIHDPKHDFTAARQVAQLLIEDPRTYDWALSGIADGEARIKAEPALPLIQGSLEQDKLPLEEEKVNLAEAKAAALLIKDPDLQSSALIEIIEEEAKTSLALAKATAQSIPVPDQRDWVLLEIIVKKEAKEGLDGIKRAKETVESIQNSRRHDDGVVEIIKEEAKTSPYAAKVTLTLIHRWLRRIEILLEIYSLLPDQNKPAQTA
jgi:hypothetical protein